MRDESTVRMFRTENMLFVGSVQPAKTALLRAVMGEPVDPSLRVRVIDEAAASGRPWARSLAVGRGGQSRGITSYTDFEEVLGEPWVEEIVTLAGPPVAPAPETGARRDEIEPMETLSRLAFREDADETWGGRL